MTAADAAVLLPGPDDLTGRAVPGLVITPTLDAALDHAEALLAAPGPPHRTPETPVTSQREDGAAPALPAAALIATPATTASQRLRGVLESGRHLGGRGDPARRLATRHHLPCRR